MNNKHHSLEHLNNSFIYLSQIGWEACDPNHSCTGFRDMHLIHIIKSGKGYFEIDGQKHTLGENEMFYLPPNSFATYCSDSEEPWEYYYFGFNGSYSLELIQSSIFKNNNYTAKLEDCSPIIDILSAASDDIMTKKFPHLYGCEVLFKILPFIMTPPKNEAKTQKYIDEAENYIRSHFHENISIKKIADFLNIDRSYFYRIFKNHFGISPIDYLINIRFQKARELLSETDLSTNDIAKIVGYENYPSFYIMFQKKMGIPPQEFRFMMAGHDIISEKRSLTAIRTFKDMTECEKLHLYRVSDKKPIDVFLESENILKDSRCYELNHNLNYYTFFGYEFYNSESALNYFVTATDWEPQNKKSAFKFKSTNASAELAVLNDKSVYRLCADDIESLNMFRHIINDHFTIMLFH